MTSGRKHVPTDSTKQTVFDLCSFGITFDRIAKHIGISDDILRKYYDEELRTAEINRNAEVANVLFKKATVDEDLGAVIFWLKTRGRWSTTHEQDAKDTVIEQLIKQLATSSK